MGKMKRRDVWLDRPVDIDCCGGTSISLVEHVCTVDEGNEYVEDTFGEIYYLKEINDKKLNRKVSEIVEKYKDDE